MNFRRSQDRPCPVGIRLPAFAAILMLAGVACQEEDSVSVANGELEADPPPGSVIDFGTFVLDEDDEVPPQTLTLRNIGSTTLRIFEIVIEGDDGTDFVITENLNSGIGPNGEDVMFIRFEPRVHRLANATLRIVSNDVDERETTWTLQGNAADPCRLAMGPEQVRFQLGEIKTVELRTTTQSPCAVRSLDIDETLFRFQNPPELPVEVSPGTPLSLEVEHDYYQPLLLPGEPVRQITALAQHDQRESIDLLGVAPVFGCLTVEPSGDLLFPNTPVGVSARERVTVINACDQPVDLRGIKIGTGFESFGLDDPSLDAFVPIPAFGEFEFDVVFNSDIGGNFSGNLLILTGDTRNPQFRKDLQGQADPPQADVFPKELDFGTVTFRNPIGVPPRSECRSAVREVRMFPVGRTNIDVESVEIDPSSDDIFAITSVTVNGQPVDNPNGPFVVPNGGDGLRIGVTFVPTRIDPAEHRGLLRIRHNAVQQVDEIELFGESAPDIPIQESFEQAEGPKVDILWVIDNSCSMADEQERLAENLDTFTDFADSQDADYQMAVTVTDGFSQESGKFRRCVPLPAIIKGTDPQREAAFQCTFRVGTDGPGLEAGLSAARNALELAQSNEPNLNTGFLRDDADLAIVIVSDEEDGSENFPAILEYFQTVMGAGRASRTKVHAIAGPVFNQCGAGGGGRFTAQPGIRYWQMTQDTDGLFFDICERDWQPILNGLGLDTFEAFDTWFLEQSADPSTLFVSVDGRTIPRDEVDGYTYVFSENAVRFNGSSVPGPGDRIEVRYSNLCAP